MHYKVYGYYRQEQISDKIVTLINYPAGVLPGTATVPQRGFANWEEFVCRYGWFSGLRDESRAAGETTASPHGGAFNIQAAIALISILNPHELLFTGDLLQKDDLQRIHTACEKCIPKEYMPDFVFLPSTDEYYLKGMYWTAMDRKENEE